MSKLIILAALLGVSVCTEPRKPECGAPVEFGKHRACPAIYRPVCGTDGKTYPNECTLCGQMDRKRILIYIAHEGECDTRRSPRCYPEAPLPQDRARACTAIYAPVCASDGRTYSSECTVCGRIDQTGETLQILHSGACKQARSASLPRRADCTPVEPGRHRACPLLLAPICGTDGVTYDNECLLCGEMDRKRILIGVAHQGDC